MFEQVMTSKTLSAALLVALASSAGAQSSLMSAQPPPDAGESARRPVVLMVTPISATEPGELAATLVTWDARSDGADAEVVVSIDGGGEQVFARGGAGSASAPWIGRGKRYVFTLRTRGGSGQRVLASQDVYRPQASSAGGTAEKRAVGARIVAMPNPVPGDGSRATTFITWQTGDDLPAQVFVSTNGDRDILFASGTSGSAPAPWIAKNRTYRFSLRGGPSGRALLGEVTVVRLTWSATQRVGLYAAVALLACAALGLYWRAPGLP